MICRPILVPRLVQTALLALKQVRPSMISSTGQGINRDCHFLKSSNNPNERTFYSDQLTFH